MTIESGMFHPEGGRPRAWSPHPRKLILMTPLLVVVGGALVYFGAVLPGTFFHLMGFRPPISKGWAPYSQVAWEGRQIYLANGCIYCHSSYVRPQDVRQGLFYTYPRISLPGDFVTTDSSPNVWGTARIGPDLQEEGGNHPDDWEYAHFSDPRFVTPQSLMPRYVWLSNRDVENLAAFVQERSMKLGYLRVAGQKYAKRLQLAAHGLPAPPRGFEAEKLTMDWVANNHLALPHPPKGTIDGLALEAAVHLMMTDRSYWLSSDPLPITKDNLLRGRWLFQDMCIGCHGDGGSGVSMAARYFRPFPQDFGEAGEITSDADLSPGDMYYAILRGVKGTAMESFGTRLRVGDIWRVVLFLGTIASGGLSGQQVPTTDMYLEWKPTPAVAAFVARHPLEQNKRFTATYATTDPWREEAESVLAGAAPQDTFDLPGFGTVSLDAATAEIKRIYFEMLDVGYRDFDRRGGSPKPPLGHRDFPPEEDRALR